MSRFSRTAILGGVLILFMAFGGGAFGGEQPKSQDEMSIEELRSFQGYYFSVGGRDPLTMRYPTSSELGLDQEKKGGIAPTLEEMEQFLTQALEAIVAALKNQDYDGAIKASEDAMYVIDNDWPPLKADPPHLRRMDEEIRNYNHMAVALKTKKEIQDEFTSLHVRVQGVIWSPTDAKAVVNGRLLAAGEIMLAERQQGDLRVEMIEEHGVVFQFKGMRFRIPIEIYAPPVPVGA